MSKPEFPHGVSVRPAGLEDAAEMAALFNAIAEAEDTPERLSLESMQHELTAYFSPLDERTRVVRDSDSSVIAYATSYLRPAEASELRAHVHVFVGMDHRDRGLYEPLMDWGIDTATGMLRAADAERRFVCAWLYKKQEHLAERWAALGFEPVRHWWEMERPLSVPLTDAPASGFRLVPMDEDHDESVRLVHNAAFADHWGSVPMDEESFRKNFSGSPAFRRQFSYVAVSDGEVVGYATGEEYPEDSEAAGRREVWIGALGVLQSHRKRGIASALLTASMKAMKDDGVDVAMIGVDSDSPSGAQHLYTAVGFETSITSTTWQLEVDPG